MFLSVDIDPYFKWTLLVMTFTRIVNFFSPAQLHMRIGHDEQLLEHSDLHVLDFKPTLKTLCFIAIKKYGIDDTYLPQGLK